MTVLPPPPPPPPPPSTSAHAFASTCAGDGSRGTAAAYAWSRHAGKRAPPPPPPPHCTTAAAVTSSAASAAAMASPGTSSNGNDRLVQQTNDDSVVSKRSAVAQHYFDDVFLRYFVHKPARRSPLINRGYYLRMVVMTDVVTRSVYHLLKLQQQQQRQQPVEATTTAAAPSTDARPAVQVVSIGAGYDTLAFRLLHARSPWRLPEDAGVVRFYEIDFPAVMAAKATLMRAAPPDTFADEWLQQMPSPVVQTTTTPPSSSLSRTTSASSSSDSVTTVATTTTRSATSDGTTTTAATATAMSPLCRCGACRYHAVGVDLRGDGAAASWLATLRRTCAHFSPDVPTVIYAECVTQYLPPHDTAALLRAIAAAFPTAVWVSYDQLRPHDSFGALMCRALQQRGAPLLGIRACASGRAATRRALRCGFACAVFANFFDLSRHHLCGAERARVDALEAFDEAEEWSEMCAHYGLTLAATQPQLTAGVLAAVPALQVVAPMCVPTCTPPPPSHAQQQQPQQQPYARACSASDTRATMTAVACTHGSKASNKHSNKPNGSGASCRVEQREWPSGGRFAFDGWGNGGAAVEVDDRGDDANGNGDVVVVCFGGFEVGRSHQRVNRVYCHSLRRGELTVVATLLRNHDDDEQQQQQQQPPRRLQAQTSSGSNAEGGKPSCKTPREATTTAPQMPARVFHTFTRLRACCYVVFGGRSNPSAASNTAYLLECEHDSIFATTASSTSVVAATWRELRLVRARRGARSGGSSSDHDIDDDERDDVVGRAVSCMISRADDDDDDDDSAAVSTPPVPEPRYRHTATAISPRELFVFGGRSATGAFLGDAWLATIDTDAGTIAWRRVSLHGHDVPAALCSAAAVAVPRDDDDDDNNNDGNNNDAAAMVAAATSDESARRRRSCDNNNDNADAEASAVVVVLSGGLQYGERCSNALWWIDVRSGRCVRVTAVCAAVGARFSHTLTRLRVDGRDTLLVLGGCVCEARAAERTDDDDQDDDDADADVAGYGCGVANANGSSGNGGEEGVVVPAAVLLDVAALRQYVTQQQQRQLQQQQQLLLLQQQRSGGGGGGGEDELVQCTSPTMPPAASSDMSSAPLAQPLVLPRTCPSWARHACVSVGDGVVAVMGGGYACFSFGTFTAKPCLLCLGQQHALNTSRSSNSHNNTVTRVSWTATTATTATTAAATAAPSRHHDDNNATNTRTRPSHAPPPPSPHSRVAALPHRAAVLLSLPRRPPVLELPYSAETFVRVATLAQRPVVFRRVPLGACVARWASPAYLKAAEGDTVVSVHVAPPGAYLLDFVKKNFRFAHVRFRELVDHVVAATATAAAAHTPTDGNDGNDNNTTTATRGETWYYRSIAARMRSERADVWRDFARLGADFVLPPGAHEYIMPRLHQSCLRINAPPLQLWTHYDTRDNVLCQIVGHKRVVFFPPSAYNHLYMTGSSSAVLDLDAPDVLQYPRFVDACKCATEVTLGPGDMVYFPAQWFHHVTTLVEHGNRHDVDDDSGDMREARVNDDNDNATAPYSVSVNVFFDHFATGEYDAKDLYGNKDPLACTALQQAIVTQTQQLLRGAQLLHTSAPLPSEYVEFALRQAIAQLERVADELAAGRRGERVAAVTTSSSSSSSSTASANKT